MRLSLFLQTTLFILFFFLFTSRDVLAIKLFNSKLSNELSLTVVSKPSLISRAINMIKLLVHKDDPRKRGWVSRIKEIEAMTGDPNAVHRLRSLHELIEEIAPEYPHGNIFKNLLKEIAEKLAQVG